MTSNILLATRQSAVAIAVLLAMPLATAQTTSKTDIEEVVTVASPIKDSQMAAIEAKRVASNVMEVIAADTIGRFPDQNLADSLGRVPGLAIERDQGQARYINFRGMPFRYTAIGFDGIDVHGAENGRIPRFDSFPSVITRQIQVNKAVLPSMTGEAVAGYVNIETFNPFDKEGLSGDFDFGLGEQELGGGDVEKFGSRLSFSNEQFGVMAFYSKNSREQITDNREYDLEPAGDELVVNSIDMRSYKLTREDEALGGRIEYRFNEGNRIFVSHLYSEFTDFEERTQYVFNFATSPTGPVVEDAPVFINRLLQDGYYSNSTETTTLGIDYVVNGWQLEARYNQTKTEFATELPIIFQSGVDFINGRTPDIKLVDLDISNVQDPLITPAMPVNELVYGPTSTYAYKINWPMDVDADKLKLDATKAFSMFNTASTLSLGAEYNQREVNGENAVDFDVLAFIPDFGGVALDVNNFVTQEAWYSNTTNSINATYWDNKGLRDAWEATGAQLVSPAEASEVTSIEEDILAVYAMLEHEFDWGNVVYGVRIEQTDYVSTGTLLDDETGDQVPTEYADDFTNLLPSAHINYNLSDDVIVRASFSSGVNRPTYTEWRAAAAVDPTATPVSVSGGNPALEPEESMGIDASIEYYFAPASILSAGVFMRSIDNVIYADVREVDGTIYGGPANSRYELSGPVNGRDGEISGLELNLLAVADDLLPALSGFGISMNATFVDSEFVTQNGTTLDLPGTSDLIYNASVFFEKFGVSARLNYQYRDEWISPIEDPTEYWGEQKRVDFNVQYDLPLDLAVDTVTLYFNANNLTDETDLRFAGNGTVNQSETYGSYYLLGLRFGF